MKRTIINFTWEHPDAQKVFIERSIMIDTEKCEITEFHERQRAFALYEVVSLLEQAGFVHIECFRDLERHPATESDFGVFVCCK